MMKIGDEKTTTVKLDSDWLRRLDDLAKRAGLSRRQLMKNMMDVGIDKINVLKMLGFFKIGLLVRHINEKSGKTHSWNETGEIKPASVTLNETTWDILDKLSEAGDISCHKLVRNIIYIGIEELELYGKVGVFQINDACKWLSNAFGEIIDDGQKALNAIHSK